MTNPPISETIKRPQSSFVIVIWIFIHEILFIGAVVISILLGLMLFEKVFSLPPTNTSHPIVLTLLVFGLFVGQVVGIRSGILYAFRKWKMRREYAKKIKTLILVAQAYFALPIFLVGSSATATVVSISFFATGTFCTSLFMKREFEKGQR